MQKQITSFYSRATSNEFLTKENNDLKREILFLKNKIIELEKIIVSYQNKREEEEEIEDEQENNQMEVDGEFQKKESKMATYKIKEK